MRETRRVFSRNTYNGYHMVSLDGPEDDSDDVIGFWKKSEEKDEFGFMIDESDSPKCEGEVPSMLKRTRPWEPFLYVPTACQKCIWLYHTPGNEFDCILLSKDKSIRPSALITGSA